METGHLVFATLHTQDAGSTVDRLIDVYPENQQQQIRVQVASTLRAVVVQTLIPRASGHGRAPATEVMINTPAVAALIRGGKAHQIRTVLQSGEKEGMHTLDQDLARLVNKGVITFEDAFAKVQVLEEFEKLCGACPPSNSPYPYTIFTPIMSNTAETPTIIQPDVSANRATNLRKRLLHLVRRTTAALHCLHRLRDSDRHRVVFSRTMV